MANIFVRSTDGSDADSGATWALAKAPLTGAAGVAASLDPGRRRVLPVRTARPAHRSRAEKGPP